MLADEVVGDAARESMGIRGRTAADTICGSDAHRSRQRVSGVAMLTPQEVRSAAAELGLGAYADGLIEALQPVYRLDASPRGRRARRRP
jgi:hypothetical protein